MSLDRPITSEDVERKQLFRTRGGGAARVVANNGRTDYPWDVRYEQHEEGVSKGSLHNVNDNGSHWTDSRPVSCDLISRITEPAMENQVVLDDTRKSFQEHWVPFEKLPQGCIFEAHGTPNHVRVKLVHNDLVLSICPDGTIVTTLVPGGGDWKNCRPLPHLRLRLTLEDRP